MAKILLGDIVFFPIERWRINSNAFAGLEDWTGDNEVQAVGRIVRVQTNGMFNYDIEYGNYDGEIEVCTRVRSKITPMKPWSSRMWRLLYG